MRQRLSSAIQLGFREGLHWLVILLVPAAVTALWVADPGGLYESSLLLTALNFVFSTVVLLLVVYLVGRSFLARGEPGLLLFGCGALVWACGSVTAALITWRDLNITPTISNLSGCLAALCHMVGVAVSLRRSPRLGRVRLWLASAYTLAIACVALIVFSAVAGWLPPFFIQGEGGTPLRYLVLGSAITMFILTAVLLILGSREPLSNFAYYYALALILIATGFFAVMVQSFIFSPLFWAGLATQFLGGAYMLKAVLECLRAPQPCDVSLASLATVWRQNAFCAGIRNQKPLHFALRYAGAFAAVAAGAGLRTAITMSFGDGIPTYLTFLPAVAVVALLAGFGPGLLATVLTVWVVHGGPVAGTESSIASLSRVERMACVLFVGMGILISTVASVYRRNRDKAAAYDRERALHESRSRLAAFAEATFEGIVETESGRIVDCNEQFARMTGYSVAELNGRFIGDLIAPEDRDAVLAKHRDAASVVVECAALRKDGSRIFVEAHGRPLAPGGTRRHTAVRDITERRRTERELRAATERLEAHMANSPLAVIEFDASYRVIRWSGAAERIFGWTAAEIVGKALHDLRLVFEDDLPSVARVCDDMATGRRPRNLNVNRNYRKDGSIAHCEWYNSAIYDPHGRLTSVLSRVLDVTARMEAAQALRQAEEQLRNHAADLEVLVQERTARLQATVEDLEQYSYSISHDMRAPLRAMNEYAHIVLETCGPKLDPEGQMYLKRISAGAVRLDSLIHDVLSYHRLVHAEIPLEPVDLDAVLRAVIEQYPMIEASRARIEIIGALPSVQANVGALTQCVSNLLGNAVKFVAPGVKPVVRIRSEPRGSLVRIWIADNGIGIDPAQVDRIWRMFHQADATKSTEGTGIGLAIVKKAIERMQGHVGVASVPGQGSSFWFELHRADARDEPAHLPATAPHDADSLPGFRASETSAGGVRVVVVDDSEDDIFILCRALERNARFKCVATISSGQDAIRYFRRDPPFADPQQFPDPDLLLLDLKMPGVDGFSVLEYLRDHLPLRSFKVVVLTSSNIPADRLRSHELGADAFETKPADHAGYVHLLKNLEPQPDRIGST